MKYLKLNSGGSMPIIGYGTWQATDSVLEAALNEALECGYRYIDTAMAYRNEHVIGKVLKEWISSGKLTRDELFIVTKLPPYSNRPGDVEKGIKKSLQDLQLDYIDLYLMHCPFAVLFDETYSMDFPSSVMDYSTDLVAVWKVMEKQKVDGRAKAIGVSNFNINQLQRILDTCKIKPDNLQVEIHLYFQQHEIVDFCQANGIVVTAYSCLGARGGREAFGISWDKELPEMLEHEVVVGVAEKHGKTPAQVCLRYTVQRNIVVIPKSTNAERLKENMQIFDFKLDTEDMKALKSMDAGEAGRFLRFLFFPKVMDHPEYPFPKVEM